MKPLSLTLVAGLFLLGLQLSGQVNDLNNSKKFNLTTFAAQSSPVISQELITLTPEDYQQHAEFGKIPFNAGCTDCIELLDHRTSNTRYFVKNGSNGTHFFVQTASNDLHYQDASGNFITIDPRLKEQEAGVFTADIQPVPTKLDMNTHTAAIRLMNGDYFTMNKNITSYSTDNINASVVKNIINNSSFTVGEEGTEILNAFPGTNQQIIFEEGSIKTSYIINNSTIFDASKKYFVIEEVIDVPEKFSLIEDIYNGALNSEKLWEGDLILQNEFGIEFARFDPLVAYDSDTSGTATDSRENVMGYTLVKSGPNSYTLKMVIKSEWLCSPFRVFPITIDPLVTGATSTWTGANGSSKAPAWCSLNLLATTPANATLTNATVFWRVMCTGAGCSSGPATSCYADKVQVQIVTTCGTSPYAVPDGSLVWVCGVPACALTTDWIPTLSDPTLVSCFTPQCTPFDINFQIKLNRVCTTGPACNTNCIWLKQFSVTIEGHTVEATMLTDGASLSAFTIIDCAHQYATLTAGGNYGVPPYTYSWSPTGGTGSTEFVTPPMGATTAYTVTITDACGNTISDVVNINNPCAVLPLELIAFSGYHGNQVNHLNWVTASEKNTSHFEVERSEKGEVFNKIGDVQASENASDVNNYSFTDDAPSADLNYYRLKAMDLNGDFTYSNIIAIHAGDASAGELALQVKPDISTFLITSPLTGDAAIYIYDMAGQQMLVHDLKIGKGSNTALLNCNALPPGTYVAVVKIQSETAQAKFIAN